MHDYIHNPVFRRFVCYAPDQTVKIIRQLVIQPKYGISLSCGVMSIHKLSGNQVTGIINHNGFWPLGAFNCSLDFCIVVADIPQ